MYVFLLSVSYIVLTTMLVNYYVLATIYMCVSYYVSDS